MKIRDAVESDLPQINEIYNWHSENDFSTFQEPTSLAVRAEWFKKFSNIGMEVALVLEEDGLILGLACSFVYRGGGVFQNTLETSIYLRPDQKGSGLGTKLYKSLFERLEGKGIHRVVVGIALPNDGSVAIHKKFGFEEIGIFDEYAFYKGAYRSSLWMHKRMN